MNIACTNRLIKKTKVTVETPGESSTLGDWHAKLGTIPRYDQEGNPETECLVFMNDMSRYTLYVMNPSKETPSDVGGVFLRLYRQSLKLDGFSDAVIEKVAPKDASVTYTKTKSLRHTAHLNHTLLSLGPSYPDAIDDTRESQPVISHLANTGNPLDYGDGTSTVAADKLTEYLPGELKPYFSFRSYDLTLNLPLIKEQIIRRITVPGFYTLRQFHSTLQYAFGWDFRHYYLFLKNSRTKRTVYDDFTDEERALNPVSRNMPAPSQTLESFLEDNMDPVYLYDMGDSWEISVRVNKTLENERFMLPCCTDGEGTAPPEDIGGVEGYADFLEALKDESHPDHEDAKDFAQMNGPSDFDKDIINLTYLLHPPLRVLNHDFENAYLDNYNTLFERVIMNNK